MRRYRYRSLASGVLSALALVSVVCLISWADERERTPSGANSTIAVGGRLRVPGLVNSQSDRSTLVVILRTTACRACQASLSFWRELVGQRLRVSVVLVGPDRQPELESFARQGGLQADAIIAMSPTMLRVRMMPTLVLLNGDGVVMKLWHGELSAAQRSELLAAAK